MGSSGDSFRLRWNDFGTNIMGSMQQLREDEDFLDVSLVTSDSGSKVLEAHRVVLAACSNFFKQILRRQSRSYPPNPFIFLRGISFEDLAAVLEFMYHGEVKVSSEKLGSFLAVAEELQIKGLTNRKNAQVVSRSVNDVVKIARPTTGTTFLTIGLQYFISLLPTYPLIHPDLRACLNLPISCFLPTFFKLPTYPGFCPFLSQYNCRRLGSWYWSCYLWPKT